LSQVIQIEQLVDEQKIGWFNIWLLVWSFLTMFTDGYDIQALSYAAPELVRHWGIDRSSLGPVFSASNVGILLGAPLMGWLGDRYGRKVAIVTGCIIYGLSSLAMMAAHDLTQMFVLRAITGIGLGGLMPNTIALNSELAPKRWRATLVVLMFTGITLGSGMPGPAAAWLVPQHGWPVLFLIGGIVPLLVAVGVAFALPESVKFLAKFPARRAELLKLARRMRPDLSIAEDARFAMVTLATAGGIRRSDADPRALFAGGLGFITPLLWVCFCTVLMSNYFLNNWMPLLFEDSGLSVSQAALNTTLYHVGGTVGGLLIAVMLDRFGFVAIAALCGISIPFIAAIGQPGISPGMLEVASLVAGFGVLGAQFGNNASAGLIYPTSVRSTGVGWAFGIGRFGSIMGPIAGGILIAHHLPIDALFRAGAAPMLACVIASLVLTRLCYTRYGGLRLDDTPVTAAGATDGATRTAQV